MMSVEIMLHVEIYCEVCDRTHVLEGKGYHPAFAGVSIKCPVDHKAMKLGPPWSQTKYTSIRGISVEVREKEEIPERLDID